MAEDKPLRIPLKKAYRRVKEEDTTVLDVVDPGSYARLDEQIVEAVRINPRDIDEDYQRLPEDQTVLAYCT